jgi:hypothetical protein
LPICIIFFWKTWKKARELNWGLRQSLFRIFDPEYQITPRILLIRAVDYTRNHRLCDRSISAHPDADFMQLGGPAGSLRPPAFKGNFLYLFPNP